MKNHKLSFLLALALPVLLLAGCGGSSGPSEQASEKPGTTITARPTLAQLQADLRAVGKELPDFMAPAGDGVILKASAPATPAEAPSIGTRSLMTVLTLTRWIYGQSAPGNRTQWYECNLTSGSYPTDVEMRATAGDPDLYVFTPLRVNAEQSLWLIGYDVTTSNYGDVGSFKPAEWTGTGRYIAAVRAYGGHSASFNLRFW